MRGQPEDKAVVSGNLCVIRDKAGSLIDNIDTDQIYHNAHLAVTRVDQMGQFAFGNLPGWEHFPKIAKEFQVLIVGRNFGAGSSRQQAVDCLKALGIRAIVAESFAPIYFRNAINSGLAALSFGKRQKDARDLVEAVQDGAVARIELESGRVLIEGAEPVVIEAEPLAPLLVSIVKAGGLFDYARASNW